LIEKPKKPLKQKTKRRAKKPARQAIELRAAKPEIRNYQATKLSTRKSASGAMQIVGTAIVFESESQDLGGFVEIVKYQSVQKSLQRNNDVFLLWQHNTAEPLSRTKTGSLVLTLTQAGLDFEATLPNSPLGQNAFQAIADGTVDSVSFGFAVEPNGDKWIQGSDGKLIRELWDINVLECSPVTWAAYLAPHVDSRSCPASLRGKLKRQPDDDIDDPEDEDDDSEDERRCDCECSACIDGRCEDCDDPDCEDEDCLDKDCPMQDEERTRKAHFELLLRRLR
jgi:HK97 family phage prohead protease